ncbi:MAG: phytanoyl-CoA dioxygenase family protein [Gammaproteobacteria bacterium]|nr:phytanoyl-CoA dioxygenase family protein [Gammaproteobacteria bacterium]
MQTQTGTSWRPVDYGAHEAAMQTFLQAGAERAMRLGNRGPIRFLTDGTLHPDIREAYSRCGFYVFTGVIDAGECAELEADLKDIMSRLPEDIRAKVDAQGRPAIGSGCKAPTVQWVRPLSDPLGGTQKANGRHPAKMIEPEAPQGSPEHVVQLILGALQFSPAFLRLYAHPELLRVAAAINGEDFVPFNEAIWMKHAGLGGSVAWHQDGTTHWDSPDLDEGTHGFNFMGQLYGCTPANGVWVVPGSHRVGKVDIKAWVESAGSDRLPDAVPLVCAPGDVAICNRQAVHGSFANTSPDPRVTFNFGFHRRRSVLGAQGGGIHNVPITYDDDRIDRRAGVIALGIAARKAHRPEEAAFDYQPYSSRQAGITYSPEAFSTLSDYNLLDLGI